MARKEEKAELIYKDECYAIVGACFEVYKDKGCGFLEPVYHECLEIEFEFNRIPFLSKPSQTLQYRGRTLVRRFSLDFLCYVNFGHYPKLEYERLLPRQKESPDVCF